MENLSLRMPGRIFFQISMRKHTLPVNFAIPVLSGSLMLIFILLPDIFPGTENKEMAFISYKGDQTLLYLPMNLTEDFKSYNFSIPKPEYFNQIRLFLATRKNKKIQIEYLRFFDENHFLLFEKNFLILPNGWIKSPESVAPYELMISRAEKGDFLEMITLSNTSHIHFLLPDLERVKNIELRIRGIRPATEKK
jgi:hypothetical protein